MNRFNLNLFHYIRDNESEFDERIAADKAFIENRLFDLLRCVFAFVVILELFPSINSAILKNILYFMFFLVIWIEPLLFSIKGLWEGVLFAKLSVIAGCIIAVVAVINILKLFLLPNIYFLIFTILIGLIILILNYLLYTIAYIYFIKKQDYE